jgi:hypothetical protein
MGVGFVLERDEFVRFPVKAASLHKEVMAEAVYYYSHENLDTGEYDGLLRLSADRTTFEYVGESGWVEDSTLMRKLVDPGSDGPELITLEKAGELAGRYGVTLGA